MNVRRSKDSKLPKVFEHKVADVRGGVGVAVDELGDDYLLEGTPISRPENGLCHVVKTAELTEALTAEATEVKVKKFHHFKEDDFVMLTVGAKAVKVTKVNRKAQSHDIITLESALGQVEKGKHLLLAKEAAESNTSELKYTPFALVGTGKKVSQGDNLDTDAWYIGGTRGANIPPEVAQYLTGIINY